jgi:hypothetical protein
MAIGAGTSHNQHFLDVILLARDVNPPIFLFKAIEMDSLTSLAQRDELARVVVELRERQASIPPIASDDRPTRLL